MKLEITVTEEGFITVAADGERIGMLKSVSLKTTPDGPEVVIEAFKYEGMPEDLSKVRAAMRVKFPWLTLIEVDPLNGTGA